MLGRDGVRCAPRAPAARSGGPARTAGPPHRRAGRRDARSDPLHHAPRRLPQRPRARAAGLGARGAARRRPAADRGVASVPRPDLAARSARAAAAAATNAADHAGCPGPPRGATARRARSAGPAARSPRAARRASDQPVDDEPSPSASTPWWWCCLVRWTLLAGGARGKRAVLSRTSWSEPSKEPGLRPVLLVAEELGQVLDAACRRARRSSAACRGRCRARACRARSPRAASAISDASRAGAVPAVAGCGSAP